MKKVNSSSSGMTTEQLRRKADRIGLTLRSGFTRNKYDGTLFRDEGGQSIRGYELYNRDNGNTLDDNPASLYEHSYYCRFVANLDDIESYLKALYKNRGMKW